MAWDARSGLKREDVRADACEEVGRNGLGCPFGIPMKIA